MRIVSTVVLLVYVSLSKQSKVMHAFLVTVIKLEFDECSKQSEAVV